MEPDEDAGKKKNEEKPVPTGASSSRRAAITKTDFEMEPDEDAEKKKSEEKPVPTGASSSRRAAKTKTDFEMEPDEDAGMKKKEEKSALKRSRGKWRAAEDESEEEDIPKKKRTLKNAAPKKTTELCEKSTNLGIISEKMAGRSGHHECQVLPGLRPEAEESEGQWRQCQKNPRHLGFLPAPDFINKYLTRVRNGRQRKRFRSAVDLTVKLRVGYTSHARPDGFTFSNIRGKYLPRLGTGFISIVSGPENNEPCECHGRKQWEFVVATALHVVYDDDEALKTVVDVFYDDKESCTDGRMKSMRGVKVMEPDPDKDVCHMMCVTCDEDLGQRIESALRSFCDVSVVVKLPKKVLEDLGLQQSCSKNYNPILIVSHPHGQPKQVTVGKMRYEGDVGNSLNQYTTPTCPGSSGAPAFLFHRDLSGLSLWTFVHNGSCDEPCPESCDRLSPVQQLNYGHHWWW